MFVYLSEGLSFHFVIVRTDVGVVVVAVFHIVLRYGMMTNNMMRYDICANICFSPSKHSYTHRVHVCVFSPFLVALKLKIKKRILMLKGSTEYLFQFRFKNWYKGYFHME